MKFEYEENVYMGNPVAAIFKFNGGPNYCMGIKAQSGKSVWLYDTGLPSIQDGDIKNVSDPVKLFYPGDKVTITF